MAKDCRTAGMKNSFDSNFDEKFSKNTFQIIM